MNSMNTDISISEADQRLRYWFDGCPGAAVALSGGVDSSLVAWYARQCLGAARMYACIADSPSLKRQDLNEALTFCKDHDIPVRQLATAELQNPNYASNPANRCYFCKTSLYDEMLAQIDTDTTWACSGANADDQGDYRPGLQAAAEHQIRHPLLECDLHKNEIRALAREHRLNCWDKPASPCLSSRIPYGQSVDTEKLARIEAAEHHLQQSGFNIVRVRHDHDIARIEVPREDIDKLEARSEVIQSHLLQLGFTGMEIDQEGFISGKLNRSIGQ